MDATVIVAAMGFAATVLAAWATSRWQRQGDRESRILDAKLRVYGDCSGSLYEYARATFNRVAARIDSLPEASRQDLRQEAYRSNARARSAIGQVAIVSGDELLRQELESARELIGELNRSKDRADLKRRSENAYEAVSRALDRARSDLGARVTAGR